MYSLWRGDKCLGYFEENQPVTHHDRRVGAAGILIPNQDMDEDCSMMQTRIEIFPGSPIFQSPEPLRWIGPTRVARSLGKGPRGEQGVARG